MSSSSAVDAGRACHGLAVRLRNGVLPEDLHAHLARAADRQPALKNLRLWSEATELSSEDPRAVRRRNAELSRPAAPGGLGVRAVLLTYRDGPADLVVVAHRDVLGRDGLSRLASALRVRGAEPPVLGRPSESRGTHAGQRRSPAWGLGDPDSAKGHAALALDVKITASDDALLAAVPLVLAQYEPDERPAVGVLGGAQRDGALDLPDGEQYD